MTHPFAATSITALGAVSSVGLDAATMCASIRAGISRPLELDGHMSMSYLDYELAPTVGHAAPDLALGFSNVGRWLQLASPAIEDLCASGGLPLPEDDREFWAQTVAYFVVPEVSRRLVSDPETSLLERASVFRDPLLARVARVFAPAQTTITANGRIGVFKAIRGTRWTSSGPKRVIVVATDSLVDAPALEWLEQTHRLKTDMNPVGLSPGEASVAVMLEEPHAARARGAASVAVLHAIETDSDAERSADKGPGGFGLARVTSDVLTQTSLDAHGAASTVGDLNGEVWRAKELSVAQMRVGAERWDNEALVLPAVSTGDPGAAMSALQLVVACKALQRGYAGGASVLVTSSALQGHVGAAIVGKA